jgi:hypothetical protein
MPQYHRVLVRYRLDHSDQWSPLNWCDIELNDSEIRVKVAEATLNAMPAEREFIWLPLESAKKLLVLDCSGRELASSQSTWPLQVGSYNSDHATYCLVTKDNEIFRVPFQPTTHLFNQQGGLRWITETHFDNQHVLRLLKCFTPEEIKADPRLRMRSDNPADNYDLLAKYSTEEIETYQQQYRAWQAQRHSVMALEDVVSIDPEVGTHHPEINPDQNWLLSQRRNPVDIAMAAVPSGLENSDRYIFHTYACHELTEIKRTTNTQEEYQRVLYTLVSNAPIPLEFSEDLISKITLFRNIMLRDSDDLNELFAQEGSTRPSLYLVYQYVLELVFLELQTQDCSLVHARSDLYVAACPDSYLRVYLGRANPRQEVLFASVASVEDDARLARRLDEEQRRAAGPPLMPRYHGRHSLFRSSNRSGSVASNPSSGIYSVLFRVMGAGLCTLGVYVAWSSFFTGVAIIAAGLCCLLAAVALSNNNIPARDYVPPAGAFWGM